MKSSVKKSINSKTSTTKNEKNSIIKNNLKNKENFDENTKKIP
jgi:hypothetical protein